MTTITTTVQDSNASHGHARRLLIEKLSTRLTDITKTLYDTDVTPESMHELHHHFADDIFFKDPWQHGGGKDRYVLGLRGFHSMLNFDFTDFQAGVTLEEKKRGKNYIEGKAIIDGIMNLRQFSWIYTYPLRTIIVYKFRLFVDNNFGNVSNTKPEDINFEIYFHEEMWSFGGITHVIIFLIPLK